MASAEEKPSTEGENCSKDVVDSAATLEAPTTTASVVSSKANGVTNDDDEGSTTNAGVASSKTDGDTNGDEKRPSDLSQPSSKKRRSDIQINKDMPDNSDGDGDGDLNDEGGKRSDPFARASQDVLQKRKIVKASSKWSGADGGTKGSSGGMFSSVNLAPKAPEKSEKHAGTNLSNKPTSVFGSGSGFGSAGVKSGGFGSGFGNVSHGFGSLNTSSPTKEKETINGDTKSPPESTAFGGGFSVSSGFGSLKPSTTSFAFGSTDVANNSTSSSNTGGTTGTASGLSGSFATSPKKSVNTSQVKFPTSSVVDTANGEQDEDCLCQVRAKLFKMVPEDESLVVEDENKSKGDVLSVPSSSGRMELAKPKKDDQESSPEVANKSPEKEKKSSTTLNNDEKPPKLVRKEAGIGPVRVLKRKPPMMLAVIGEIGEEAAKRPTSARVVQRQETSGGQATKVILNIRLVPKTCNVTRRSEKYVQLVAPNSDGKLESILFLVKTLADADTLEKTLKAVLDISE